MPINKMLILGPRMRYTDLTQRRLPVNSILCLLKKEEGATELGETARKAGYQWCWWPLDARPHSTDMSPVDKFLAAGDKIERLLDAGNLYVHCAAGIHRTGMAAYTYYRVNCNYSRQEAYDSVVAHRAVIATDAADKIEWLEEQLSRVKELK